MFPLPSTDLPKPPVPYTKGWKFTVQSHTPPTPVTRDCCRNFKKGGHERNTLSPIERCLKHLPLPGKTEPYTVNILGANFLSTGRYFKPVSTSGQQKLVAKVYNPLYYDDDEDFLSPFVSTEIIRTRPMHTPFSLSVRETVYQDSSDRITWIFLSRSTDSIRSVARFD